MNPDLFRSQPKARNTRHTLQDPTRQPFDSFATPSEPSQPDMKNQSARLVTLVAPILLAFVASAAPAAAQGGKSYAPQQHDARRHSSPGTNKPLSAPEIDPALAAAALTLVVGAALILTDRTRARGERQS